MQAYPSSYTEHNLPLILLSGLGQREEDVSPATGFFRQGNGTKISISSPECRGERADLLLEQLALYDGSHQPWNASSLPGPSGSLKYKLRTVGRSYTLPLRKAAPLPQSPSTEGLPGYGKTELHSPLSPLSPGCPCFPDGVFTALWCDKHQKLVPCLFLAFFDINGNGDGSQDDQLKSDINTTRTALSRSGFKTRFAAVLLSDTDIVQAPGVEERLASIRRVTSLDSKTGLFVVPPMSSQAEIATFLQSMMSTLQPLCIDYYRDLTKHARRKKTRGGSYPTVSSPAGASSHTLSTPGWNVRYEVKQGIFAEFRQELDVAERHFSAAIDELFTSDGIFEATPSWSPRWEEARLLCDTLAIRVVRCYLWSSLTSAAAQSWLKYKLRTRDLIDRRGKGSQTYGWEAWESRWAEIMSQLIQRADLGIEKELNDRPDREVGAQTHDFYIMPERAFSSTDRFPPFQYLHHSGYWTRLAAQASERRSERTLAIPEEDRSPPGQSPASTVANRVQIYESYLSLEPHEEASYDHSIDTLRLSQAAVGRFERKDQRRISEMMMLEMGRDLVGLDRFHEAFDVIHAIYVGCTWRQDGWLDQFAQLLLLLRQCALKIDRRDMLVATTYELLAIRYQSGDDKFLDLGRCLDGIATVPDKAALNFTDRSHLSPFAIAFAFESNETHVGDASRCQFTIKSHAHSSSAAMEISHITLSLNPPRMIRITHDPTALADQDLIRLSEAVENGTGLEATGNLTFNPGRRRTFAFNLCFRESQTCRLDRTTLMIQAASFTLEHSFTNELIERPSHFLLEQDSQSKILPQPDTTQVTVHPKPPKARLVLHELRKQCCTGELIRVDVEIVNDEVDTIHGKMRATSSGDGDVRVPLRWLESNSPWAFHEVPVGSVGTPVVRDLPSLSPNTSSKSTIIIKAPAEPTSSDVLIEIEYVLSSDSTTTLRTQSQLHLTFVVPFEVHFDLYPALYKDAWPSLFNPARLPSPDASTGIPQLWRVIMQIRSLVPESVVIHGIECTPDHVVGDSTASISNERGVPQQSLESSTSMEVALEMCTCKHSIEDRRPTSIDAWVAIKWSRDVKSEPATCSLPVPRLTLPVSEPRVLCTVRETDSKETVLHYHLENPSSHFLTFALTMEASEEFAFSGPKYRTLSLAPFSRHWVEYRLLIHDTEDTTGRDGGHWVWPSLQVVDSYYRKALRVHPGGRDVKMDEQGRIGVRTKA